MAAQQIFDVRDVAGEAAAPSRQEQEKTAIDVNRHSQEEQAAAAAVVDAAQAEAVAAQAAAEGGVLPTQAPLQGIGEIAQAPAPAPAPAATETTAAAAPATPAAEAAGLSPWAIGGIAALGVGGVAAVASGGSDNAAPVAAPAPAPVPVPVPAPPPPPPANVAPTSADKAIATDADGQTALSAASFAFNGPEAGDTLKSVTIGTITPTVVESATLQLDEASGHAYQFVAGATPVSWAIANQAAIDAGGHLLVIDSAAELALIRDSFAGATANGLGSPTGQNGTWIGLAQDGAATTPTDGWNWVPVAGAAVVPFPGNAPTWNTGEPNDSDGVENGEDQWAALYQGTGPADTQLIYDWDNTGLPNYIIEFESALTLNGAAVASGQVIDAAQLGNLSWNSVFNDGGTVAFNVTDSGQPNLTSTSSNTLTFNNPVSDAGPSQSLSAMIDDPNQNVLA